MSSWIWLPSGLGRGHKMPQLHHYFVQFVVVIAAVDDWAWLPWTADIRKIFQSDSWGWKDKISLSISKAYLTDAHADAQISCWNSKNAKTFAQAKLQQNQAWSLMLCVGCIRNNRFSISINVSIKIWNQKYNYFKMISQSISRIWNSPITLIPIIWKLWGVMNDKMLHKHKKFVAMHIFPPPPPWKMSKFIFCCIFELLKFYCLYLCIIQTMLAVTLGNAQLFLSYPLLPLFRGLMLPKLEQWSNPSVSHKPNLWTCECHLSPFIYFLLQICQNSHGNWTMHTKNLHTLVVLVLHWLVIHHWLLG